MRARLAAAVLAAALAGPLAAAEVTRVWNTPADFQPIDSYSTAVVPSGGGRAYLTLEHQSAYQADPTAIYSDTGGSFWSNDPKQGLDWRITKYDPTGSQLWTGSYNSQASDDDDCFAVGLDAAGDVVAAGDELRPDLPPGPPAGTPPLGGGQGFNLRVRKLDPAGGFLATDAYNNPAVNRQESGLAVTVSASGAAVVVGVEDRNADLGQRLNWLVRRYDPSLGLVFAKTYNGPANGDDFANAVAFDAPGGFVVAGTQTNGAGTLDWAIQRYDANGNPGWNQVYHSPGNLNAEALGLAISRIDGTIAVVGYENRADIGQGKSWLVREYSSSGGLVASIPCASVTLPPSGRAQGAAFDLVGKTLIAGWENRADLSEGENWVIRKYDEAGSLIWLRAYDGPAHGNDRAMGVAMDAGGSSVVVGFQDRSDVGQGDDWLVRRYDPDGLLSWSRTYNDPNNGLDHAMAVALDQQSRAVVAGYEHRDDLGQDDNWFVRKYDSSGVELWTRTLDGAAHGEDRALAVAVASGSAYVGGYETVAGQGRNWRVVKYGVQGNVIWTLTFNGADNLDDWVGGIAADGSGSVYIAGTTTTAAQGANWQVIKATTGGQQIYALGYNDPDNLDDVVGGVGADRYGNFTVAGTETRTGESADWRVTRYGPDGTPSWSANYNDPANGFESALGVAVSLSGSVMAVGYEYRPDLGAADLWHLWFRSPSGADIMVSSVVSSTCSGDTVARAAAFDPSGNLVVVGYEDRSDLGQDRNWLIRKYEAGTHNLLWTAHYNSQANGEDEAQGVACDPSGNIIVVGYVTRTDLTQGKNWVVRKYTSAGAVFWPFGSIEYNSASVNDDVARSVSVDAAGNIVVGGTENRFDLTQLIPLPNPIYQHAVCMIGNRVYVIGGCQTASGGCGSSAPPPSSSAIVRFAPIDPTGDASGMGKGRIGPWTKAFYLFGDTGPALFPWGPPVVPTQGVPIRNHRAIAVGNRIYVVGGTTENCGAEPLPGAEFATKNVWSTAVDPVTGQTGPWEPEIKLLQVATEHGLVYAGGALYALGGEFAPASPHQYVQKAEIAPNGHLYSSNGLTWEAVRTLPPGNPNSTCGLCSLCSCGACSPCTEDCCRALNVCLGWLNMKPISVGRTIAFLGGEYVPGSSGNVCRYSGNSMYGFLDDCNGIRAWLTGAPIPPDPALPDKARPGAYAVAYNGSLLSVAGGNGSGTMNQVLYNSAGTRGVKRTGGSDQADLRPANPDGTELSVGSSPASPALAFPVGAPSTPIVAYNGFVYAVGGEIGGSSACPKVYRAQLSPRTDWVDAGYWLSPPADLGGTVQMTQVSWSFSKTGPGTTDDWALVRYRVADESGIWSCWTPRVPEEGSAPATPGYYHYGSDVPGSNPFFRMPLAPNPFRYIQFEVSLYNDPTNDSGAAPTIPAFDEFRLSYKAAVEPPPPPGGTGLESVLARDGKGLTLRFEVAPEGAEVRAEFFNVAGEMVSSEAYLYMTGGVQTETVEISRWAPGVYIIRLKGTSRTGDAAFISGSSNGRAGKRTKMVKGRIVVRR